MAARKYDYKILHSLYLNGLRFFYEAPKIIQKIKKIKTILIFDIII
jgi:hypothetical protein